MVANHGDAKILYLLAELTNCPKAQSSNVYDRCKVVSLALLVEQPGASRFSD
jgi:hypothetical protein